MASQPKLSNQAARWTNPLGLSIWFRFLLILLNAFILLKFSSRRVSSMQRIYCLCWSYGVNGVFLSLLFLKGNKNVPRMNVYSYIVTLLYFFFKSFFPRCYVGSCVTAVIMMYRYFFRWSITDAIDWLIFRCLFLLIAVTQV